MGTIFQVNESNGAVTITGAVDVGSHQIHSVTDPTSAQDAATKNYVDTLAQGITWKQAVAAGTVTVLPFSPSYSNGSSGVGATLTATTNGVLTIDGYTVLLNDRILVQNQASALQNGIYSVTTLGTASVPYVLTRTTDYDTPTDVQAGTATFVQNGTVNADSGFVQTTTGTIIIGTTALSFTQFTGLGEVTAGTGLTKSGNTISLITPVIIANGGTNSTTALTGNKNIRSSSTAIVEDQVTSDGSGNLGAITSLTSNSSNPASTGFERLASTDVINWRNNANSADISLAKNTSDQLTYAGSEIASSSGQVYVGNTTGTPTFPSETLSNTTNQLTLGTTHTVTISSTAPSASRTYTLPDAGTAANFVLDQGNYTIGGTWTFSNSITLASTKALVLTDNSTDTVSIKATNSTTTYTLSLPTTGGTTGYFLQTDGSGNTSWQPGGSGTVQTGTAPLLAFYATSTNVVSNVNATASMGGFELTNVANGTAGTSASSVAQAGLYALLG